MKTSMEMEKHLPRWYNENITPRTEVKIVVD